MKTITDLVTVGFTEPYAIRRSVPDADRKIYQPYRNIFCPKEAKDEK